jgi:hypothetical protein
VRGTFDPIDKIADVCEAHGNLWLHVDGAWGGSALYSQRERVRSVLNGIERCDSFSTNPHKMLGSPLQASQFVSRHKGILNRTNASNATYLFDKRKKGAEYDLGDSTFTCGRKTDGLKIWSMLKYRGLDGISERVNHGVDLLDALAAKVRRERSEQEEGGVRARGCERSEQEEGGVRARGCERSEQEEGGAATIRLSWARSKKKGLLLTVSHGRVRRRRGCCYPSLMGSLEEDGAAAVAALRSHEEEGAAAAAALLQQKWAESRAVGGRPPEPPPRPARLHSSSLAHYLARTRTQLHTHPTPHAPNCSRPN